MFRARRTREHDRWLEWKVGFFSVAAVLALAGIYLEERWMTGGAILVLLGAVSLRLLPGEGSAGHEDDEDDLAPGEGGEAGS